MTPGQAKRHDSGEVTLPHPGSVICNDHPGRVGPACCFVSDGCQGVWAGSGSLPLSEPLPRPKESILSHPGASFSCDSASGPPATPDIQAFGGKTGTCGIHPASGCLRAARGCRPDREINPPVRTTTPPERIDPGPSWSLVPCDPASSLSPAPHAQAGTCGIRPVLGLRHRELFVLWARSRSTFIGRAVALLLLNGVTMAPSHFFGNRPLRPLASGFFGN